MAGIARLRRQILTVPAVLTLVAGMAFAPHRARADDVVVFAAASLKNALDDAISAYPKADNAKIVASYGASSALAKQLENGANADVFVSADLDWMDDVRKHNGIDVATRKNFLGNKIVLVAPAAAKPAMVDIKTGLDLKGMLKDGKLAMADPDSVPAGKYGKAALEKLGIWASVADRVAAAENVRAALLFVSRGEAPYGIVYATDAVADKGVVVVGVFPEDSHPPIIYPMALTATSKNPAAKKFLDYLESPAAKGAFEKQGFTVLP
jgi:molybdate transport system substrate-binding protein